MLPTPVMPEILLRRAFHPTLECRRVVGDDALDIDLEVSGGGGINRLEAQPKSAIGLTDCRTEDNWRAESQREDGGTARRFCESAEERHPRRREADSTLIDEKGDGMSGAQRARDTSNGLVIMDDGHSDPLTRPRQISIEERVRHVASNRVHREASRREIRPAELPIPEVTADKDESLLTRKPLLDDAPPFDFLEQ